MKTKFSLEFSSKTLEEFYNKEAKERKRPEIGLFQGRPFKIRTYLYIIGTEI